jgi:hypothetical protein
VEEKASLKSDVEDDEDAGEDESDASSSSEENSQVEIVIDCSTQSPTTISSMEIIKL